MRGICAAAPEIDGIENVICPSHLVRLNYVVINQHPGHAALVCRTRMARHFAPDLRDNSAAAGANRKRESRIRRHERLVLI